MGTEEILVTEFRRHASLGYNELYKKNCPLPSKVRTCLKLFDRRNFTKHVRERIRRMRRKKHDKCVHTENNELKILKTV